MMTSWVPGSPKDHSEVSGGEWNADAFEAMPGAVEDDLPTVTRQEDATEVIIVNRALVPDGWASPIRTIRRSLSRLETAVAPAAELATDSNSETASA